MDAEDLIRREPAWIAVVAGQERWGEREWRQWHTLAGRFFADFRIELDRTNLGPYATGPDFPFTSEMASQHDERPWLDALHRLCGAVADVRRSQGWDV